MPQDRLDTGFLLNNRYEILDVVGRGGMGCVYRARDNRLDIIVAVKEMMERDGTDEEKAAGVRQFEREAKFLGQLHHANLPRVTDYFVEGDRWYLIMEFVVGGTLEFRMRSAGPDGIPLDTVIDWAIQTADVLSYLHCQDPPIVFRDVKPANVMVNVEGIVKLIDFGIARRFQDGATKDTLLYGSPGYSPPEQYGRAQTDPRSDVYALGATIHHMVTGRDPASAPFRFPLIRTIRPSLPVGLEMLLAKCVEMDENKRVQTAAELRDTLIHIRTSLVSSSTVEGQGPLRPAQYTPRQFDQRTTSRNPQKSTNSQMARYFGIGAAAVVLVGAITYGVVQNGRKKAQRPTTNQTVVRQINPGIVTPSDNGSSSQFGTLSITTEPSGAIVYIDEQKLGNSPCQNDRISVGRHTLKIVPPSETGYQTITREITIEAGKTSSPNFVFSDSGTQPAQTEQVGISRWTAQKVTTADGAVVRIIANCRLRTGIGKTGMIAVYFLAGDKQTSLHPSPQYLNYRNDQGILSVTKSFPVAQESVSEDVVIELPSAAFPEGSLDTATARLALFIDGQATGEATLPLPVVASR